MPTGSSLTARSARACRARQDRSPEPSSFVCSLQLLSKVSTGSICSLFLFAMYALSCLATERILLVSSSDEDDETDWRSEINVSIIFLNILFFCKTKVDHKKQWSTTRRSYLTYPLTRLIPLTVSASHVVFYLSQDHWTVWAAWFRHYSTFSSLNFWFWVDGP